MCKFWIEDAQQINIEDDVQTQNGQGNEQKNLASFLSVPYSGINTLHVL